MIVTSIISKSYKPLRIAWSWFTVYQFDLIGIFPWKWIFLKTASTGVADWVCISPRLPNHFALSFFRHGIHAVLYRLRFGGLLASWVGTYFMRFVVIGRLYRLPCLAIYRFVNYRRPFLFGENRSQIQSLED